jgi:hypothetical protein
MITGAQQLVEILENALDSGADKIELERQPEGLEVCVITGGTGLGYIVDDRELEREILRHIIENAKLKKKTRGTMRVLLHQQEHTINVAQYETFGEIAFRLTFNKSKPSEPRSQDYDTDKLDDAVLALLYLTMFKDGPGVRAWKGHDWSALQRLFQKGYIHDPKNKAKSVVITEKGAAKAEKLFRKLFGKKA